MRLIVYSHDAFGLGNIRRMLAICNYLLKVIPELSILVISGSPVLHSFRIPQGLDYIKLPCLGRNESGDLSAKYLHSKSEEVANLRAEIIKTAAINFEPDLILVDKKPYGLYGELEATVNYIKERLPKTKLVLLLRDILDAPEVTIKEWTDCNYYQTIEQHYDRVLVVGMPEIFDVVTEYKLPTDLANKTSFCGYVRREHGSIVPEKLRQQLQVTADEKLVLVTPGGGGDGYRLVKNYLAALTEIPLQIKVKSVIVLGPEMPRIYQTEISQITSKLDNVLLTDFTDDLASYIEASEAIVCMGGYNTICEILSLGKRAIIVPRVNPVQEQWIRAQKMSEFGLFKTIHPQELDPKLLAKTLCQELKLVGQCLPPVSRLDLDGLPRIANSIIDLVYDDRTPSFFLNLSVSEADELVQATI
jgi:predicted glycosyltransferase